MTSLAILSDTHMPRGTRRLPDLCVSRLRAADLIVHAGDLTDVAVLKELEGYGLVHAVAGNADSSEVQSILPEQLVLTLGGATLGVIHDSGRAAGRLARMRARFAGADAVIFGHSHVPLHARDEDTGFQLFNPGSPTDKRRQSSFTMGWADINGSEIRFTLIRLSD